MLNDKAMVSDTLVSVNGELTRFGEMITQTENKELKQCLKQLRNECEILLQEKKAIMFLQKKQQHKRSSM